MRQDLIKEFIKFAAKEIGIENMVPITLVKEKTDEITTAGYYPGQRIIVRYGGRHDVDVCRSLGHEMQHHKQMEEGRLSENVQDIGGVIEDEANAVAGQLIKKFAKAGHKEIYENYVPNKQLVTESRIILKENKLRIFDFDDTLVRTDSFVYVKNPRSGKSFKLTPAQYAVYEPEGDDLLDFSDFDELKDPETINKYFDQLVRIINAHGKRKVAILTARGEEAKQAIYDFLESKGITGVEVVTVGKADPQVKTDWIEDQIKNNGITDVMFADDSKKNIDNAKQLIDKYPNVKFNLKHVKHPK